MVETYPISLATISQLNYFANHPLIFKSTGFPKNSTINMSNVYDDLHSVGFSCPIGAMLFEYLEPGVFECHFLFIPGSGGKDIKGYARAMADALFTNHGASVIKGFPPRDNRAVRALGVALGFVKVSGPDKIDGFGRICGTYELRA